MRRELFRRLATCPWWFALATFLLTVGVGLLPPFGIWARWQERGLLCALGWCIAAMMGALVWAVFRRKEFRFWLRQAGWFFSILCLSVLFLILIPEPVGRIRPKAALIACRSNLRQIHTALKLYAGDHNGFLPPENGAAGLNYLIRGEYLTDRAIYVCTWQGSRRHPQKAELTEEECGYIFYGGGRLSEISRLPLLMDKPGNHPKQMYNVLYTDGTYESVTPRECSLF